MDSEIKERYKLYEAAEKATRGNLVDTKQMLKKLSRSIRDGSLKVFLPGSNTFYVPEADDEFSKIKESDLLRSDVDLQKGGLTWVDKQYDERLRNALYQLPSNFEVYWDDLNAWLEENEPRLGYQFYNPDTPFTEKERIAVKGLTKQKVITAFEGLHFVTAEQWSRALANTPKWLEPCKVMKGTKKTSALWNPVLIAVALLDKYVPIKKLDAVFVGLKDWTDEWKEVSATFRD